MSWLRQSHVARSLCESRIWCRQPKACVCGFSRVLPLRDRLEGVEGETAALGVIHKLVPGGRTHQPSRFDQINKSQNSDSPRDLKTALLCISFLRKGEVLAYVGRIHNLKDLKDLDSHPFGGGLSR